MSNFLIFLLNFDCISKTTAALFLPILYSVEAPLYLLWEPLGVFACHVYNFLAVKGFIKNDNCSNQVLVKTLTWPPHVYNVYLFNIQIFQTSSFYILQVILKLIVPSGKSSEFLLPQIASVGEVTEFVYKNWPEGQLLFGIIIAIQFILILLT